MFVTVLIAAQGRLDSQLVANLASAWGASAPARWLSPGEAAEFDLAQKPDTLWEVWANLQTSGVDLAVVPAANRRKRLLIADMDSTMIGQECIDELAAEAGIGAHVAGITARAMNGELDFEAALTERVALLKGLPMDTIQRVLDTRITYTPGGAELVATMRANGAYAALVSGGFTDFTQAVAARLGFDENRANRLLSADGKLTGETGRPILGRAAKVDALRSLSEAHGLTLADTIAVGDGANDLGMLQIAGMGVALHAKPVVAAQCELRITHGDLSALLFLQGYSRQDFVTSGGA